MSAGANPGPVIDRVEKWLQAEESARRPVAVRVAELLDNVRCGAQRNPGESWDQANERHAEDFIHRLAGEFPGRISRARERACGGQSACASPAGPLSLAAGVADCPTVIVERQTLPPMARRTTRFNYIFTVPGRWRSGLS